MIVYEVEVTVCAPIDAVFDRLVDLPGYADWLPTDSACDRCRLTCEGPVDAGSTYVDEGKFGPMTGEIVELQRPTRVVFHQVQRKLGIEIFAATQTNVLEELAGATRVRHQFVGGPRGPLRLLTPVIRPKVQTERCRVFEALQRSYE